MTEETTTTRIAIPSELPGGLDAQRAGHFGRCACFTLVDVADGEVKEVEILQNAPHVEGGCMAPVLVLAEHNVNAIVVQGIGGRPLMGFNQVGIAVLAGVGHTTCARPSTRTLAAGFPRSGWSTPASTELTSPLWAAANTKKQPRSHRLAVRPGLSRLRAWSRRGSDGTAAVRLADEPRPRRAPSRRRSCARRRGPGHDRRAGRPGAPHRPSRARRRDRPDRRTRTTSSSASGWSYR